MNLIYLDKVQLPVAPGEIKIKIKNQNKTLNLINDGEINILKTPGLTEIAFEVLLPNQKYYFASYPDGYHSGNYYLDHLEALKVSGKVFDFTMIHDAKGGTVDDFNMLCSLEEYELTETTDQGSDFTVSIKLKQYKAYATMVVTFEQKAASLQGAPKTVVTSETKREAKTSPGGYTVLSGDTLWGIAQKTLGSGGRWKEIYNLNAAALEAAAKQRGKQSSSQGKWIYAGTALNIPK